MDAQAPSDDMPAAAAPDQRRANLRVVAWLTGAGVAFRLLLLLAAGALEPHADESHYLYSGLSWSHFGFYPDTLRFLWPPAYPYAVKLAIEAWGPSAPFALKLAQVAASAAIGSSIMLLALRIFSRRAAAVAGALWAGYLPLAAYTHYLWPETFFLACFTPALALLVAWWDEPSGTPAADARLFAVGLLLGLSLLVKEVALYLCPLLAGGVAWRLRGQPSAAASAALLPLAAVALVILPLTFRNYEVFGRFVPVGETLGKNVMMGLQHPFQSLDYNVEGRRRIYRSNRALRQLVMGTGEEPRPEFETERDTNLIDQSRGTVRDGLAFGLAHPGFALRSRIVKVANWVSPTSFFVRHYGLERYHGLLDAAAVRRVLVLAALGLSAVVIAAAIPGLLLCLQSHAGRMVLVPVLLYFLAVAGPVQGASRYRVPIEPLLIVLAAGFLAGEGRPWRGRRAACRAVAAGLLLLVGLWSLTARQTLELVRIVW